MLKITIKKLSRFILFTCVLYQVNCLSNENSFKVFKNYVHIGFESNLIENVTKPAISNRFFCLSFCSKRNECKMVIENKQSCFLLNTCFDINKISIQNTSSVYVKNVLCLENNNVQYIPTNSNITIKNSLAFTSIARSLVFLQNGFLASGHDNSSIFIRDVNSGNILTILFDHSKAVNFLFVNKDGELVSGSYDGKIYIWNFDQGTISLTIQPPSSFLKVSALAILENGDLACSYEENIIRILDQDGIEKATLNEGFNTVNSIVVLNESFIASGNVGGSVIIWNLNNNTKCKQFLNIAASINILAVLKNGDIAIGAIDPIVRILNINEGKIVINLTGHSGTRVNSLAVLPNGDLISGSDDKSIIIWNMKDGIIIKRISGNIWGGVESLAVLNSSCFASGSLDGQLIVWG